MEQNEPINLDTIFSRVMEILDKSARDREEWDRKRELERKEWDRKSEKEWEEIRQNGKKIDERLDKLGKNIAGLSTSVGGLMETLMAAKLWEKFDDTPYNLKRAYLNVFIYDDNHQLLTEIDILLSNTDYCMAVEVKTKAKDGDVDAMINRMGRIHRFPPAEAKGKRLLGALAGGFVPPEVRDYAHKNGLYVLELQGESVDLAPVPEGFSPRIW